MREIIEQWKREALGARSIYKDTTAFHIEGNTLYLLTTRPGLFIGYHGNLINKYKEKIGMDIRLIELREEFVKEF